MAIEFTPAQRQAIDSRGGNILVSAAAGSGKTAVLAERIVEMVCDGQKPVDVDRLLVVTFTNAAAAEMRERIADGIAKRLAQCPESEHIQKQSALLHNALITTIDSFSLFLLRNHFNEIGLDPAFRVADEGEIRLLAGEVLSELLEERFSSGDPDFQTCVEVFCPAGRESVLEEEILYLSRYAASFPWPEEWLARRKHDYDADTQEAVEGSDYGKYLKEYLHRTAQGCREKLSEALELCRRPEGPYMYEALLEEEADRLRPAQEPASLQEWRDFFAGIAFGKLSPKKDDSVSTDLREYVKALRNEVKETVADVLERFFATPEELSLRQGQACRRPVETLIDLVISFDRMLSQKKRDRRVVDFSDMEHFALDILLVRENGEIRPSQVALEYRQYFHEILIDEYQDSNLVQEYLLRAVSGEEDGRFNRFMVGDVKQSIYKFRLARPEIFLEKYERYQPEGQRLRIDLSRNFRSRASVIDSVNGLFEKLMSGERGGLVYDERARLYAGADYPESEGTETEFLLIDKPDKESERNAKQAEAAVIAKRIHRLRESFSVTDKKTGQLRPVRYGDMVILLRTNSGWDETFKEVLEGEGIPVYITAKTGYFAAREVQELLQLLRVLDNPGQDIPLFGVLKSVFGGFDESEIATIRIGRQEVSLWEALRAYGGEGEESDGDGAELPESEECLKKKVSDFLARLDRYRARTTYLPIRELLERIVEEHHYLEYVTALPAGARRRANVEMLFTKASDFEKTSYFGLFHFVRYIELLEKYDVDYGGADTLDENADAVRIMSIHKSKGLEFPVVFVAGLSKRFNMQDANQALLVDMDLGLGCDYVDPVRRIRNKTLRRVVLARKMREDNLAEELRVLYVALTRAREKLILTATLAEAARKWESVRAFGSGRLGWLDYAGASGCLDWLLPLLPESGVRVELLQETELERETVREQIRLAGERMELDLAETLADREKVRELKERFEFVYPYRGLEKLYTKTTVSELKHAAMAQTDEEAYRLFDETEEEAYIPSFMRGEEKVSGTVRGSAFHRAMELLDLERVLGGAGQESAGATEPLRLSLRKFLQEKRQEGRLSEAYYQALNETKLLHFLESPLAGRMRDAALRGELYREQPFVLGIESSRLGEEFPEAETVLIQGIIDVFFVEDGGIVLLDYKTDVIDTMADLWNRYGVQMDYYGEALERLTGLPVREKLLYSFYLEEAGAKPEQGENGTRGAGA